MKNKFTEVKDTFVKSFRYLFDGSVSLKYKLIPLASIIYLIYPFDFLSDFLPFLGQVDDLSFILLAFAFFVDVVEKDERKK